MVKIGNRYVTRKDVIRVKMIDMPEMEITSIDHVEMDLGVFEWQYDGAKFKVVLYGLKKDLAATVFKSITDDVISRVVNFNKVYLLIPTKEVMT